MRLVVEGAMGMFVALSWRNAHVGICADVVHPRGGGPQVWTLTRATFTGSRRGFSDLLGEKALNGSTRCRGD